VQHRVNDGKNLSLSQLYDWVTGRGGGGGGGGGRGGRRKHYRRLPQSVHDAMVHND